VPLDLKGTDFQLKVWNELRKIPFGTTVTYQEVAERIGEPKAVRNVAAAIEQNPIAVLVPSHRVIHADGTLGEYHWGRDLKKKLIEWERDASLKKKE
jgi:O-6-methylguanine DNA methyltransferase